MINNRKGSQSNRKTKKGQSNMIPNNLYVNSISIKEIASIFAVTTHSKEYAEKFYLDLIVGIIGIYLMVQLRTSVKEQSNEYVDKLPSYKDYKKKIILSAPGRTLAVASGLVLSFPYIMETLDKRELESNSDYIPDSMYELARLLLSEPLPNTKRIPRPANPTA